MCPNAAARSNSRSLWNRAITTVTAIPPSRFCIRWTPHYSTLLKFDPANYPQIVGDLAHSWTVSPDRQTYTFKLRPNVLFHDGSKLTSADIKASYERIAHPSAGVVSSRQVDFGAIGGIDRPEPLTVVFTCNGRTRRCWGISPRPGSASTAPPSWRRIQIPKDQHPRYRALCLRHPARRRPDAAARGRALHVGDPRRHQSVQQHLRHGRRLEMDGRARQWPFASRPRRRQ